MKVDEAIGFWASMAFAQTWLIFGMVSGSIFAPLVAFVWLGWAISTFVTRKRGAEQTNQRGDE